MKIGAFGEVMLRLTPPEFLMLEQTHTLRMAYTGTGVNLVGNLAHFGVESYLLTALPDNRLGDAALANLKSLGINTSYVIQKNNISVLILLRWAMGSDQQKSPIKIVKQFFWLSYSG